MIKTAGISRTVSLAPSITQEIVDLGYGNVIIGVTSFDTYRRKGLEIVGTLVQPNIEKIITLKPDIVLCSEEDGLVQNVERLSATGIKIQRFTRSRNFDEICGNYILLGRLLNAESIAKRKVDQYRNSFNRVKENALSGLAPGGERGETVITVPSVVAVFVSHRPLMAVSEDSYIGQIIRDAGGKCAYGRMGRPYPLVSFESLIELDPDIVISILDEKDDFYLRLKNFPIKAILKNRVCTISPDTISYYTPTVYLKSMKIISGILMRSAETPLCEPGGKADH